MTDHLSQGGCNTHGSFDACGHTTETCPDDDKNTTPSNGKGERVETLPYCKTVVMPGRIAPSYLDFPGEPMAYFVRTDGTKNTIDRSNPGSLEQIMAKLFHSEILDFIVGLEETPPSVCKELAEQMRDIVNNPETQKKIRELYTKRNSILEALRVERKQRKDEYDATFLRDDPSQDGIENNLDKAYNPEGTSSLAEVPEIKDDEYSTTRDDEDIKDIEDILDKAYNPEEALFLTEDPGIKGEISDFINQKMSLRTTFPQYSPEG